MHTQEPSKSERGAEIQWISIKCPAYRIWAWRFFIIDIHDLITDMIVGTIRQFYNHPKEMAKKLGPFTMAWITTPVQLFRRR